MKIKKVKKLKNYRGYKKVTGFVLSKQKAGGTESQNSTGIFLSIRITLRNKTEKILEAQE